MADERSPLLQNGRDRGGPTDYLAAVNESESVDPAATSDINGSTDAEQQTIVAPQNSLVALVRLAILVDMYYF